MKFEKKLKMNPKNKQQLKERESNLKYKKIVGVFN